MGDVVDAAYALGLGPHYPVLVVEERGKVPQGNVAVSIDGGREYCAAALLVVARIIRSTSQKRNSERCSCDYHGLPRIPLEWGARIYGGQDDELVRALVTV